jgi:hypothetical protein
VKVSFDVVFLFTRVQISKTMSLLNQHFEEDILRFFCHVLMALYFSFTGQFDEQIDSMAVGSPLSAVIANFFTKDFEEMTLDQAALSPSAGSIMWAILFSSGHMAPAG